MFFRWFSLVKSIYYHNSYGPSNSEEACWVSQPTKNKPCFQRVVAIKSNFLSCKTPQPPRINHHLTDGFPVPHRVTQNVPSKAITTSSKCLLANKCKQELIMESFPYRPDIVVFLLLSWHFCHHITRSDPSTSLILFKV